MTDERILISGPSTQGVIVLTGTRDASTGAPRYRSWLRASGLGQTFGINERGELEWVDPNDAEQVGAVPWAQVNSDFTLTASAVATMRLSQPRAGWLVKSFDGGDDRIFVVTESGSLQHVPDIAQFDPNTGPYKWGNVIPVSALTLQQLLEPPLR